MDTSASRATRRSACVVVMVPPDIDDRSGNPGLADTDRTSLGTSCPLRMAVTSVRRGFTGEQPARAVTAHFLVSLIPACPYPEVNTRGLANTISPCPPHGPLGLA